MRLGQLTINVAVLLSLFGTPAHAFLNDSSNQKIVMIGKGGAQNMQPVTVTEIQTQVTPINQGYPQSSYPQSTYPQNSYPQATYSNTYPQPTYPQATYPQTAYPQNNYPQNPYQNNQTNIKALDLSLNSAAAAVFDLQSGELLYDKNMDKVRAIASVTKMMTAMVVLDAGQDMSDEIIIKDSDLRGAKSANTRLQAGDRMTRSELLLLMLMKSENPAAKALASNYYGGYDAFIAAMNQKAQSLGMYNTSFSDASGLNPRNRSSVADLLLMMREIALSPRYQTVRNFSSTPSYDFYISNHNKGGRTYKAATTNRLIRASSYNILASKTGYIREAGHCVVMYTAINNRPAIIVLLGADDTNRRWADAEKILTQLAMR